MSPEARANLTAWLWLDGTRRHLGEPVTFPRTDASLAYAEIAYSWLYARGAQNDLAHMDVIGGFDE